MKYLYYKPSFYFNSCILYSFCCPKLSALEHPKFPELTEKYYDFIHGGEVLIESRLCRFHMT